MILINVTRSWSRDHLKISSRSPMSVIRITDLVIFLRSSRSVIIGSNERAHSVGTAPELGCSEWIQSLNSSKCLAMKCDPFHWRYHFKKEQPSRLLTFIILRWYCLSSCWSVLIRVICSFVGKGVDMYWLILCWELTRNKVRPLCYVRSFSKTRTDVRADISSAFFRYHGRCLRA